MKPRHNISIVILLLMIFLIVGIQATNHIDPELKVKAKYLANLNEFEVEVQSLETAVQKNHSIDSLKNKFISMRFAFKKAEIFIEYYFPFQIYLLNAPAMQSAEDKNPPQGMQVLEEIIFDPNKTLDKKNALKNIQFIKKSILYLQGKVEQIEADSLIFDALLDEVYRITTLGISGFDSPIAKNSIPEAESSLASILEIFELIEPIYKKYSIKGDVKIKYLLRESIIYCSQNKDFHSFDRMYFIRKFLNPISIWLGRAKTQIGIKDQLRENLLFAGPLAHKYYSLFDSRIFSAGFYSTDSLYQMPEKINLGKKLFFDPILSGNNQRSCASCHMPQKVFTDGLPKSLSIDEHTSVKRNAPSLWNSALQRDLFSDNRRQFMEDLVIDVIGNTEEMNSSAQLVSEKLEKREDYKTAFNTIYKEDNINAEKIANVISAYVRSLVTFNTRFDLQMKGKNSLRKDEIRGFNLFMGKAKCATCHFVPLFSGSKPPHFYIIESEVIGVPMNNDTTNAVIDPDKGRIHMTGAGVHEFSFKTPGLRNVALTAPYMHNGVFETLEEVVDFYNKGGGAGLGIKTPNQTLPAERLNLSDEEKSDIVAFLRSLTDIKYPKH